MNASGRRDCRCPRAQHRHGTVGAYVRDRCRCFPCRKARSDYTHAIANGGGTCAGEYWTDAIGTRRRLQALAAIGITNRQVADHTGVTRDAVSKLSRQKTVTLTTARRIAAVYDQLWDKPAPHSHSANVVRNRAARLGWPGPLAWDDDEIDDPAATPHTPGNGGWDHKPCGTSAAVRRHYRRNEPLDAACAAESARDAAQRRKGTAA